MKITKKRLAGLREYIKTLSIDKTTFIVEGGKKFYTDNDPVTYLWKNGAYTRDGQRIVQYPHPVEGVDALSLSFYEMIEDAVEAGNLELPEPESDEL